ncbi:glycosyltransferase family 4 protein [Haliscomenobacter sp.]|uniref:glycosyltransferase family 4 protein n=1 Tax=Haliscomenobacter sp. TaxID=2717303 RepID=UPI003593B842
MSPKFLLVWDRMGDYHRSRWKALADAVGNANVIACDLGKSDTLYQWENSEKEHNYFLLSNRPVNQVKPWHVLGAFVALIRKQGITHVCIAGYGRLAYLAMIIVAKMTGKKVLLFAESWYASNRVADNLKGLFIRLFVDAFLVSGNRAKAHFSGRLGISPEKIAEGYSVVDNVHFSNMSPGRGDISPTLLCVARFAAEKNLSLLIEAFQTSALLANGWELKIVGGGPLKAEMENKINTTQIKLLDWVSYEELPSLYHNSNCFILPSLFEPWGLVVNEAMAAGLPIIVSEQCGCAPDLVQTTNGWIFDAKDKVSLDIVFNNLSLLSSEQLTQKGQSSQEIIANYTPEVWAKNVLKVLGVPILQKNASN